MALQDDWCMMAIHAVTVSFYVYCDFLPYSKNHTVHILNNACVIQPPYDHTFQMNLNMTLIELFDKKYNVATAGHVIVGRASL